MNAEIQKAMEPDTRYDDNENRGIRLVITFDKAGKIGLQGPIENAVLCYGLFEMAKDALREFHAAKRRSGIQPVPFMPPSLLS